MTKKFIIICLLVIGILCLLSPMVHAQNATKDKDGNFTALKLKGTEITVANQKTGQTYTDTKGIKYDVYKSINGLLYYMKQSKRTANFYKVYIKTEKTL